VFATNFHVSAVFIVNSTSCFGLEHCAADYFSCHGEVSLFDSVKYFAILGERRVLDCLNGAWLN
jgi:hypothetical protein